MNTKPVLTVTETRLIIDAASQYASERNWQVTIAVVDDGGHVLGLSRLDGAPPATAVIAPGKARTAALGRKESGEYEASVNNGRYAYLSVPIPVMLEGGVPIRVDGQVVGAIGVSGVQSHQDVEIGKAGLAALLGQ